MQFMEELEAKYRDEYSPDDIKEEVLMCGACGTKTELGDLMGAGEW